MSAVVCTSSYDDLELFIILLLEVKVARARHKEDGEVEYVGVQDFLQLVIDGLRSCNNDRRFYGGWDWCWLNSLALP